MSNTNPYQSPSAVANDQALSQMMRSDWPTSVAWSIIRSHFSHLAICYLAVWLPINLLTSYIEYHYIDPLDFRTSFRMEQAASNWIGILAEAIVSLMFGASVIYAHVYVYCWYRHLDKVAMPNFDQMPPGQDLAVPCDE